MLVRNDSDSYRNDNNSYLNFTKVTVGLWISSDKDLYNLQHLHFKFTQILCAATANVACAYVPFYADMGQENTFSSYMNKIKNGTFHLSFPGITFTKSRLKTYYMDYPVRFNKFALLTKKPASYYSTDRIIPFGVIVYGYIVLLLVIISCCWLTIDSNQSGNRVMWTWPGDPNFLHDPVTRRPGDPVLTKTFSVHLSTKIILNTVWP